MKRSRWIAVFVCAGLLAGLIGCNSVKEMTLDVNRNLTVRKKAGADETLVIAPGTYSMKFSMGNVNSKITLATSDGKKASFSARTSKELRRELKTTDAVNLVIPAAQLQQTFDIELEKHKQLVSTGDQTQKYVRCLLGYHTEYHQYCYPGQTVCHQDQHHHQVCYTKPGYCEMRPIQVADYGSRLIVGRRLYYSTLTEFRLVQGGATKATARPTTVNFSDWQETYASDCRR